MAIITPYKSSHSIFEQLLAATYMESKLLVKNFGPIKDVNLTLKNVNVFIGPQATGKSALAKLFTIFKAPRKFFYIKEEADGKKIIYDTNTTTATEEITEVFKEYNIDAFLTKETEIEFDSELHNISFKGGTLKYHAKLRDKAQKLRECLGPGVFLNHGKLIPQLTEIGEKFLMFKIRANSVINADRDKTNSIPMDAFQWSHLKIDKFEELLEKLDNLENSLSTNTATYIPAERGLINIIKKAAFNLQLNNVPIPKHILTFGAEIEKLNLKEIDLGFIQEGLNYKIINGEDWIVINNDKSIRLFEAASGIQSVVPLLSFTLGNTLTEHKSFVIEEPELNLFPIAQYDLIQHLEAQRKDPFGIWEDIGTIHTYTTHSPYILSSLNNLLYAQKVIYSFYPRITKLQVEERNEFIQNIRNKVLNIVKIPINPTTFTAYQIRDGIAQPIFNKETGLIEENFIDMATDKINEDFEALMELTK